MPSKRGKCQMEIVHIEDAEQWMVYNVYLHRGYRKNFQSIREILKSTFMQHNELMNIWTHLLGALFFIGVLVYLTQTSVYGSFEVDRVRQNLEEFTANTDGLVKHYNGEVGDLVKRVGWGGTTDMFLKSKDTLRSLKSDIAEFLFVSKFEGGDSKATNRMNILLKHLSDNFKQLQENVHHTYKQILNSRDQWTDAQDKHIISSTLNQVSQTLDKLIPDTDAINQMMNMFHQKLDISPFFVYLATAIFCLMSSAIYHTFYPLSQTINYILHKVDMAGISILVFGSSYAALCYYFYCMPNLKFIYCGFIFVNSFAVFFVSLTRFINKPANLKYRSLMFASLGLSNAIPFTHLVILSLHASPQNDYLPPSQSFVLIALMGAIYLGGLAIYVNRIPERFFPKTFDIWLNSHTIWHICVFLAALLHLYNLFLLYQLRLTRPCFYR